MVSARTWNSNINTSKFPGWNLFSLLARTVLCSHTHSACIFTSAHCWYKIITFVLGSGLPLVQCLMFMNLLLMLKTHSNSNSRSYVCFAQWKLFTILFSCKSINNIWRKSVVRNMRWFRIYFNSFQVLQKYMHGDRCTFSLSRGFYADALIFSITERYAAQMWKQKKPGRFIWLSNVSDLHILMF